VRPSERLYLNRDHIYEKNRRARQRADWLYEYVYAYADKATEFGCDPSEPPPEPKTPAFPGSRRKDPDECHPAREDHWGVIAEVAEDYPRLMTWLAEGQVRGFWNLFGAWIGFMRLIPGLRKIVWLRVFKPVARHAPWRVALHEAILQDIRNDKNKKADRLAGHLTVRGPGIPGLSAVTDVAVITPLRARRDLREKIVDMSSGCVGVSGLRGSGKTTLIRDFCRHRYGTPLIPSPPPGEGDPLLPGLRLMVEAPLRFEAREFLIHQYTCLCKAVLADVRFNPTTLAQHVLGPILQPGSVRPRALLGTLGGAALFILAAGLFYGGWPHWDARTWELIGGAVAFVAAVLAINWRTRQALIEARQVLTLAADARQRLQRLQYQRTDTRNRGGTIGGPMGTGLSLGTTEELAEQAMTMPELIDDYRDFVERLVGGLQQKAQEERERRRTQEERERRRTRAPSGPHRVDADARLVIGIDALDQIDDPAAASAFLDELSSVFGIPRCVYLIAVSPDTLAAVDQRTVPLKTSSGGLFDDMVWLKPLGLNEAGELLDRRVTGLPVSFVALCYVLSGGLPRELLRVARAIFTTPGAQPPLATPGAQPPLARVVTLTDAVCHVIESEIQALKQRTLASAVLLDIGAASELLKLLTDDHWPTSRLDGASEQSAAVVEASLNELCRLWAGPGRQGFADPGKEVAPFTAEVCDSLLAGLYFLLTVRQLFTLSPRTVHGLAWLAGDTLPTRGTRPHWLDDANPVLRDLARARVALGTSPYLAAKLISSAREHLTGRPGFDVCVKPGFLSHASAG
jgi:hypothetical protein